MSKLSPKILFKYHFRNLKYIIVKFYDILNFELNLIIVNFNHNGMLRQKARIQI